MMSDKVYCTADGDYPELNKLVRFDIGKVETHYGYVTKDMKGEFYFVDKKKLSYCWYPKYIEENIYWRYEELTSLKDEYERQKENA